MGVLMSDMNRRVVNAMLGGAMVWPLVARAQQSAIPVIGFLSAGAAGRGPWPRHADSFQRGLQDVGFIDGQNVLIEYRWAEDQYDRLPALVGELVQRRVRVIAAGPRAVDAAKAAAANIPIVFMSGSDPVRLGLVANLNRPDGNLTGVTVLAGDISAKRFGLFHDLLPEVPVIGLLRDSTRPLSPSGSTSPIDKALQDMQMAAGSLGVAVKVINAGTEAEIETALATFAREGVRAVFVINGLFLYSLSDRLCALAAHYRISVSGEARVFAEFGGLMSYGPNEIDAFRQVGRYTGRILKGEKPADLPVLQPTKFELVINLKTAKMLGLTLRPSVLAIADEIIE
jgi:putative ABC transport system substrate-binding protein